MVAVVAVVGPDARGTVADIRKEADKLAATAPEVADARYPAREARVAVVHTSKVVVAPGKAASALALVVVVVGIAYDLVMAALEDTGVVVAESTQCE